MPNINLIAARREEKKRLERLTRQLFFGLAGSVAVLAMTVLFLGARRFSMNGELREAEARMLTLQPTLEKIAQTEKDQEILRPKVETLQTAKMNTLRWRAVFQVVSQSIPDNTWLNTLAATGTGDETLIKLSGLTTSQSLVADTITRLQSHPLFDKVDLTFTQSQPSTNPNDLTQHVSFEIGAHLRSNAPKDDKKDAKPGGAVTPVQKASARPEVEGKNNG